MTSEKRLLRTNVGDFISSLSTIEDNYDVIKSEQLNYNTNVNFIPVRSGKIACIDCEKIYD